MDSLPSEGKAGRFRAIAQATAALILIGAVHVLDHIFNQPSREIHAEVFVSAGLGWVLLFVTLYLALREEPIAPFAALMAGLASALGFIASHAVPSWSALSDSFIGLGVNWLTWLIATAAVLVSLQLAFLGARALRGRERGVAIAKSGRQGDVVY